MSFFADNHAVHHVSEVEELIYGAGALLRFLPPYSPDFNPIEGSYNEAKDFVRENDVAYRCCTQPRVFILHAFLDKFLKKTVKTNSEIADTSDETQYKWEKVERTEEVTASAKCE